MGSDFETPGCRGSRQKFHLGEVDFGFQLLNSFYFFFAPIFLRLFLRLWGTSAYDLVPIYPAQDSSPSDLPICAVGKAHSCSMYSDG